MKIYFSPIVAANPDQRIEYLFSGETITATINGQSDTYDFTSFPDGVATEFTSTLPIVPIMSAKREDGVLWVTVLNFIGDDASEAERFPEWVDVANLEESEEGEPE